MKSFMFLHKQVALCVVLLVCCSMAAKRSSDMSIDELVAERDRLHKEVMNIRSTTNLNDRKGNDAKIKKNIQNLQKGLEPLMQQMREITQLIAQKNNKGA